LANFFLFFLRNPLTFARLTVRHPLSMYAVVSNTRRLRYNDTDDSISDVILSYLLAALMERYYIYSHCVSVSAYLSYCKHRSS